MRGYLFLLFCTIAQFLLAQNCQLDHAKELLDKKQFATVYSICNDFADCPNVLEKEMEWAQYQQAFCAMKLFNQEAEMRFLDYLNKYPNGVYVNLSYLALSKIYYRNKQFEKAIAMMKMVNVFQLGTEEIAMYYFRLGYSYFVIDDYEASKLAFYDIDKINFTYSDLTTYCLGHMAYSEGNYATATKEFEKIVSTPMLGQISSYYIAQIYYYQNRYQELIDFAEPLLENGINKNRDAELIRLIASAYYGLDNYSQTVKYFQQFLNEYDGLERAERYYLANAHYHLKNYDQAIHHFESLIVEKDSLSQFAAHQLAKTYLQQNEQQKAINAFKFASSIDFDFAIKEDASYNLVKLLFQNQVSYENVVETIEAFINDFPLSLHLDEVKELLIKSYTSTRDYRSAVENLSLLNRLTLEQKVVFQKLSYFLAIEHFINKEFSESIVWFEKSLQHPQNPDIIALTYYWMAEAHYQMRDFTKAVELYGIFLLKDGAYQLDEYKDAQYALAYSFFQLANYKNSAKWFRKYLKSSSDRNKLTDANLRIGDSYFMLRDFRKAQAYYSQSVEFDAFDIDYALYQQSLCFGLTGQDTKKKSVLNRLVNEFNSSIYHDDALMDLSTLYLNLGNQQSSADLLNQLINTHTTSPLVKKAMLQMGLINYNNNQLDLAINNFKKVTQNYPNTNESKEALTAFKNIAVEQGDVKAYFNYIESLTDVSVDIAVKDSLTYEAAENLYLNQKCDKAISAFDDYLTTFSKALFKLNASYYRAECLYAKSPDLSVNDYIEVLEYDDNPFTERALTRLAQISFGKQEYGSAALHYAKLLTMAQDNNLIRESTINLFICYKQLNVAANALKYAHKVIQIEKLNTEIECQARLYIANSYFQESEYHLAKKEYEIIAEKTTSDFGAESKYQLAYLYFLEDNFNESEATIFELSESYFNDYFIAKAFILLADIYFAKENYFQSKATLNSVLDNYDGDDELKLICQTKIEKIESIEKQKEDDIQKREIIIDLLNDVELSELFEEENISENEE